MSFLPRRQELILKQVSLPDVSSDWFRLEFWVILFSFFIVYCVFQLPTIITHSSCVSEKEIQENPALSIACPRNLPDVSPWERLRHVGP